MPSTNRKIGSDLAKFVGKQKKRLKGKNREVPETSVENMVPEHEKIVTKVTKPKKEKQEPAETLLQVEEPLIQEVEETPQAAPTPGDEEQALAPGVSAESQEAVEETAPKPTRTRSSTSTRSSGSRRSSRKTTSKD